ncbi:transmembrane protein 154 isoform X2 [Oryzias melastigma]|uniref:transmembrane protein 154 isoform X2 n=1 Tax=Oryzias melastigma TaxID=30732 RepID=UPI000CF7E47E|nr:transmembrane protein 154 isoform X2 [Oryzias melastigma]
MSDSLTGKMRGAWVNTPLLLLLLLLACLTRTAISQEDDDSALETSSSDNTEQPDSNTAAPDLQDYTVENTEITEEDDQESVDPTNAEGPQSDNPQGRKYLPEGTSTSYSSISPGPSSLSTISDPQSVSSSSSPEDSEDSNLMLILIPVVVVTLVGVTVCGFFIIRKLKQNTIRRESVKEDQFLEESSTEKVPMPMFEEDVPSVLELEMDDLDGPWMKKDC